MLSRQLHQRRAARLAAFALTACAAVSLDQIALAQNAFTYQGQLKASGAPYNGTADLRFTLYNAASGGSVIGAPDTAINVGVVDGVVTTELDFGALAFDGAPRWLQIEVRTPSNGGAGPYTPLTPRQQVNPSPYAMYALNANTPFSFNGANGTYTGAGNIGIGTAAPAGAKFVVQTPESNYGMVHTDGARTMATWVGPAFGAWFGTKTNTDLHIGTNNLAGQFVLTPAGDVGLSSMAPNGRLHVLGGPLWTTDGWHKAINIGTAHAMQLSTDASMNFGIGATNLLGGEPKLYFFNTPGEDIASTPNNYMVHTAGGDVGLGTTSPSGRLHIQGGPAWTTHAWNKTIHIGNGHAMELATGTVNRFGIGATSGLAGGSNLLFFATTGEGGTGFPDYYMVHNSNGLVGIGSGVTLAPQFTLHVNGTAGKPGGGSWSTASDERLKKNIAPMEDSLERILALRGVKFEYGDADSPMYVPGVQTGMIAQEVERVFPEWIDETPDGWKTLTFRGFEALAVEAMRELRDEKDAEIAALRSEVADLRLLVERMLANQNVQPGNR